MLTVCPLAHAVIHHFAQRRIHFTDKITSVERDRLAGKFFVNYRAENDADIEREWFAADNHFWLNSRSVGFPVQDLNDLVPMRKDELVLCKKCQAAEELRVAEWCAFMRDSQLRGLDLFAGCGGLATAFNNAGCATNWAVELDPSAALTLRYAEDTWCCFPS